MIPAVPCRPASALAVPTLALLLSALPPAASAQEAIGGIEATLDGEEWAWRTLAGDGDADYNTGLADHGGVYGVSVHGYVEGGSMTREVLVIELTMAPNGDSPLDQEVFFFEEGMSRFWASLDGEPVAQVTRFDPDGEIEGSLGGRLCLKESLFAEPDQETCRSIEGTFSSRLPRRD